MEKGFFFTEMESMQNIIIQTQMFYWKKHIACRTGVFLLILGEPRKRGERDSRFALVSAFASVLPKYV